MNVLIHLCMYSYLRMMPVDRVTVPAKMCGVMDVTNLPLLCVQLAWNNASPIMVMSSSGFDIYCMGYNERMIINMYAWL